jgi:hypothetical protein
MVPPQALSSHYMYEKELIGTLYTNYMGNVWEWYNMVIHGQHEPEEIQRKAGTKSGNERNDAVKRSIIKPSK